MIRTWTLRALGAVILALLAIFVWHHHGPRERGTQEPKAAVAPSPSHPDALPRTTPTAEPEAPPRGAPGPGTTEPRPAGRPIHVVTGSGSVPPGLRGRLAPAPQSKNAHRDGPDGEPIFTADYDGIREAMGLAAYDLRECYEAWTAVEPELAGRLKVRLVLVTDANDPARASVSEVALADSELQHTALEGCIVSVMRELRFDAPKDERLDVTYPLHFAQQP